MMLGEFFVLVGGCVFVSNYKHMLVMLISLEIMMLGLYSGVVWTVFFMGGDDMMLLFLGFVVCESSIGLGLLVSFVRMYGSDLFNNFSSLWC